VALMALVELMRKTGMTLLDVQWRTEHLASLGAVEVAAIGTWLFLPMHSVAIT